MSTRKRIYASFLLIIFSMVALHDLLPHAHHDHDVAEGPIEHHNDHHGHDLDGVLGVLGHVLHLHNHTHSNCEIDVCPEVPAIKQNRDSKDNSNNYQAITNSNSNGQENYTDQPTDFSRYRSNSDAFLKSFSSRGPPTDDC